MSGDCKELIKFVFEIDQCQKTWERKKYIVHATSKEEAVKTIESAILTNDSKDELEDGGVVIHEYDNVEHVAFEKPETGFCLTEG